VGFRGKATVRGLGDKDPRVEAILVNAQLIWIFVECMFILQLKFQAQIILPQLCQTTFHFDNF